MDLKRTSYEFHRQLESPSSFIRREWKSLLICAGLFSAAMLAAILAIDPAFFYPRLQTDPLNYLLKAHALVATGPDAARWAVNLPPFAYASMPGYLRLPVVMAFSEFDHQLRAMQILNIPIIASVAAMSAYIVSWILPERRHRLAIGFAFAFTLLSPIWLANVFLPLADAPYAAFTLATLIVAVDLLCSDRPLSTRPGMVVFFALLFTVSFLLRFTAPVILLFIAPLAIARWRHHGHSARTFWLALVITAVVIGLLIVLNLDAIFGRYFREPVSFFNRGEKPGMIINLFGAAFPTQIIPTFQLGFLHPPIDRTYSTSFSSAVPDMLWAGFGILISAVIVGGMWMSRARFLPEILYLLGALPVLTLMMPSTTRYLMAYQPYFWIFFYTGLSLVATKHAPWMLRVARSRSAMVSLVAATVLIAVGLRSWKAAGTAAENGDVVTVGSVPNYVTEVSGTFRSLRRFIETLPPDRTLLIGSWGSLGRWKVISGMNYYFPDSALSNATATKDVYLIIECGTREACPSEAFWKKHLLTFGNFELDSVFAARAGRARVKALRVRDVN